VPAAENGPARKRLDALTKEALRDLPKDTGAWWDYLLGHCAASLLKILAVLTAHTVDGIKHAVTRDDEISHSNDLIRALEVDLTKWFEPTAENFLKRVPRSVILQALEEAQCEITPTVLAMKKGDLVSYAEAALQGKRWIPEPMRPQARQASDVEEFEYDEEDSDEDNELDSQDIEAEDLEAVAAE